MILLMSSIMRSMVFIARKYSECVHINMTIYTNLVRRQSCDNPFAGRLAAVLRGLLAVAIIFLIHGCSVSSGMQGKTGPAYTPPSKLISINDLRFEGAFAIPAADYGDSNINWAEGTIEVDGKSLFIVGHDQDDAIAEFLVPELTNSQSIDQLVTTEEPVQPFVKILENVQGGNPQGLDQIVGLELYKGRLIGNGIEYYDAPGDNSQSMFVVEDSRALADSAVKGFYSLKGRAIASGWLSAVPRLWKDILGCSHISGHSSGGPIIARHSIGPSAFCVNLDNVIARENNRNIDTEEMLAFRYGYPLQNDLFNKSLENDLWTHLSQARYGFIVPGTSTYATFGTSGGHKSGAGYKLDRGDGINCDGYCAVDPTDVYNYYWFWDMRELLKVKQGSLPSNWPRPYASGVLNIPFQTESKFNPIGGASYDEESGLLYFTVLGANGGIGQDLNPPVVVAYRINLL